MKQSFPQKIGAAMSGLDDGFDAMDLIGLEMAGAMGYGAGLSEAEEVRYNLQDEYEEKLERKKRRIEELEDELDELREERDSWWDDDDDYDDFYDDDYGRKKKGGAGLEKYFYDNYTFFDYAEYAEDHPDEDPEAVIFDVLDFKAEKGIKSFSKNEPKTKAKPQTEEEKAQKRIDDFAEKGTYVAGLNHDNYAEVWLSTLTANDAKVDLKRDPENPHDPNAIQVMVNDVPAGFIPAWLAKAVAPLIDAGTEVVVENHEVNVTRNTKDGDGPNVKVQLYVSLK